MKKTTLYLIAFLCLIPLHNANAQSSKKIEQNVAINLLGAKIPGIGADYSIGCNIDDVFFVGGGLGLGGWIDQKDEYFTDVWLPIFIQFRSTFLNEHKVRPYISLSVGVDCFSLGPIINPNIGISIKATRFSNLHIGIGYNAYNIEYDLDNSKIAGIVSAHIGLSF